jgi:predicted DCC family thiol-disulfide oxidoreductase YuxK
VNELAVQENVILYDGYCVICNKFVNWVVDHDSIKEFKFAPLDGVFAKSLKNRFPTLKEIDSIVYFDGKEFYVKGEAVRKIINHLSVSKPLKLYLKFMPNFLLSFGYDFVAKNRYKVFGKLNQCPVLPLEWRDRFKE